MMGVRSITLMLVAAAGLGACASGPPKDIVLQGTLVASEDSNPNREGRASPVTVVIYQLKSAEAFSSGDFFNLYQADSGMLGADLIQRTDMQIQPGQSLEIASKFDPETNYIGVLAAFRDIDSAQWRAVVALPEKRLRDRINPFAKKRLAVNVDALSIEAKIE